MRRIGVLSKHVAAAATTHVKTTTGFLHRIVVNSTAAGTITVSDDDGTIAILKASVAEGAYWYGCDFRGKLDVVTAAASDITIIYE